MMLSVSRLYTASDDMIIMNVDQLVEWDLERETKVLVETALVPPKHW
jgi:hypothetical protein